MLPTNLSSLFFRQVRDAESRADRVYEPVIGIVVDNKDPDKLARVKVRFPSLPGQDTGWWAPVVSLGAGNERGWFFLPEIDDEVLVMFEHGDIRRPVVLGALWNGEDAPPDTNGGQNERRSIVSRNGSKIVFDDAEGTVSYEDGSGNGKITISKDNKITIESATGDVCVQAPAGELNIVAKELASEGSQSYHIESGSGTNIGGDGAVTIKGGTMIQVQAVKIDLNPGGVSAPAEASASPEDVPDPVGG
jgi:uncharacterized protein involved in type VI secretion and phage assembly